MRTHSRELDGWFEGRREEGVDARPATGAWEAAERPPPPSFLAAGAQRSVRLTGREEEIDLLRSSWERTIRGEQQIGIVSGEPGVGKTRLVEEFARSTARHATVLVGRCDREALVAYAPWVAILQWLIRTTPAEALRRHLAGIEAGSELAQIVPEIITRIHIGAPSLASTDPGFPFAVPEPPQGTFAVITYMNGPGRFISPVRSRSTAATDCG